MLKLAAMVIAVMLCLVTTAPCATLKNVVIISIDALHPSALGPKTAPAIYREMTEGVYTLEGRSTNPPKTLVSHSAMFTGVGPGEGGQSSNQWQAGQPTVNRATIFDLAKGNGYTTGYFYSKRKLGYLVNGAIDVHQWSREGAVDLAEALIGKPGRHFVFLHISGLDGTGPEYGWLSAEYLEELSYIDEYLEPMVKLLKVQKNYLLVITSDHAGHDKIHGSQHPDDFRLPFVISSDTIEFEDIRNRTYRVTDLKGFLFRILQQDEKTRSKAK